MIILNNKWGGGTSSPRKEAEHWFNCFVSADFRERGSEVV